MRGRRRCAARRVRHTRTSLQAPVLDQLSRGPPRSLAAGRRDACRGARPRRRAWMGLSVSGKQKPRVALDGDEAARADRRASRRRGRSHRRDGHHHEHSDGKNKRAPSTAPILVPESQPRKPQNRPTAGANLKPCPEQAEADDDTAAPLEDQRARPPWSVETTDRASSYSGSTSGKLGHAPTSRCARRSPGQARLRRPGRLPRPRGVRRP